MKKKYIWLIEIIIWLIILSGILFCFIYNTSIKGNAQNTYYIFVDDAAGLVKGSPVRLMGINIGYVRDIKIFNNKVFISFLITKDDVELPKQTSASIAFYGLGGSTSLELNPSTDEETTGREVISTTESYRIQDFWDGQKLVANTMIDIYGSIGRTIQNADLINKKSYLKQSAVIKMFTNTTNAANTSQSVIIYKLTENTSDFIKKNKNTETQTDETNSIEEEKDE